ncbi:MAG: proton-conducting transporter membrane subunit, partial [Verrucomicrobiota bacterium]
DEIALGLGNTGGDPVILSTAALFLMAFGIKAGVFPLYFWLPPAYPNTGFATAAVFGGLLTKVGVYALFRVFGGAFGFLSEVTGPLFLVVGALTMVSGVLGAASQFHTRRILSFHIVSQIGYIVLGLGLFTQGAFAAAIFYIVHHILVKTNLFLAAGAIAATGRSERLEKLGGLLKGAPLLAFLFLIPALSLGGIPPLSGFFAKFLLLREALREEAYFYAVVALLVGVVTLFSMIKIWGEAFWKETPRPQGIEKFRIMQIVPIASLGAMTITIGFMVEPLFELSGRAAEQLLQSNPLYVEISGE